MCSSHKLKPLCRNDFISLSASLKEHIIYAEHRTYIPPSSPPPPKPPDFVLRITLKENYIFFFKTIFKTSKILNTGFFLKAYEMISVFAYVTAVSTYRYRSIMLN